MGGCDVLTERGWERKKEMVEKRSWMYFVSSSSHSHILPQTHRTHSIPTPIPTPPNPTIGNRQYPNTLAVL